MPHRTLLGFTLWLLGTSPLASPALAKGSGSSAALLAAVRDQVNLPGAQVEIVSENRSAIPKGCRTETAEVPRPVMGSERVPVKLSGVDEAGRPCGAWAWVEVRVRAPVPVTTRPVSQGQPLAAAVGTETREIPAGYAPAAVGPHTVASRTLPKGRLISLDDTRVEGPAPGSNIKVVAQVGALALEQTGRVIPCQQGLTCAVLPSGKRVQGVWMNDKLLVEVP